MTNDSRSSRAALSKALEIARAYLENLDATSVAPTADLATLRSRFSKALNEEGVAADAVIADLARSAHGGLVASASGRFFGWAIGGALPSAIAADWLVSTWDQNAALLSCAPAAAVVEEVVGGWLKDLLNLPWRASFALTTGCQMAHVTCLAAARHALLARVGWDVERDGLPGAPAIRILANGQRHGSIERAARLLGLGVRIITDIPTDGEGRMLPDGLESALRQSPASAPTVVLMQAGDFHTGAFDDFRSLIPLARRYGAWVHVDGAFGLWAAASPRHRHLTDRVDTADSWAVDGHKWLNVPFDCGYAFVADSQAHRSAMSHRAAYLTHDVDARDQIDWNPEWSRRARGFPTFAALRELGRQGVADLIDRCCLHASSLVSRVGSLPGAQVLAAPIINQGVLRFLSPAAGASDEDHNRTTDQVIAAVAACGEAFFTGSTWCGRRVMRVSVCNWRTDEADVTRAVGALRRILSADRR